MLTATKTFGSAGRNLLLAALQPADFSLLAPNLKDISLSQGDVLQEAGEAFEYVYFPQSGMISLLTVMRNGSAVETATVGHEGATGAMSGLGSRIAPYRTVVQIEGTAARIAAARFEAAVNGSASIKDLIVRYSDFLMMMIQQSAGCSALHPLEKRLCRWLLQAQDRNDGNRASAHAGVPFPDARGTENDVDAHRARSPSRGTDPLPPRSHRDS